MASHRRQRRREEVRDTGNGLNLNNLDLTSIAGLLKNVDLNQFAGLIGNLTQNIGTNDINIFDDDDDDDDDDDRRRESDPTSRKNEIVKAIKTLINADRTEVLQILIQFYAASRTTKK